MSDVHESFKYSELIEFLDGFNLWLLGIGLTPRELANEDREGGIESRLEDMRGNQY